MAAAVLEELAGERPRRRFTRIGIAMDVSGTSLPNDRALDIEAPETVRAVFFGLGSDGTVGANKNTIKILGSEEGLHAQGYFVYDSKKSGSQTVSHLRFGPQPISAPYLVSQAASSAATSSACWSARRCSTGRRRKRVLLNCRHPPDRVWDALSREVQEQILAKRIELDVIDAGRIAREAGLAGARTRCCRPASSRSRVSWSATRRSRGSRRRSRRPVCSSIYGGNLPTTPWTVGPDGRGPAWSNSLFKDNAEFGLGLRLAADRHSELARRRLSELRDAVGAELVDESTLMVPQLRESELREQRERVAELERRLAGLEGSVAEDLRSVLDHLVRRSVWIVGGDGWAYDIGSGGLDHVLACGRNVKVLVLDTEVYCQRRRPRRRSRRRAARSRSSPPPGKQLPKKDLALLATSYGGVYVARVAMGANDTQTVRAFVEAEAFDGPSLIIAYSHCIAHGYDLRHGLEQQKKAVLSSGTGR